MSTIAIGRDQYIWVKKQTAKGVVAWPAATDAVLLTGDAKFDQGRAFNSDKQKRNTFSRLGQLAGPYKGGEFSFPCYVKPSGAAGTAPAGDPLYESLLGSKKVNAGTSVVYSLYKQGEDPVYLTVLIHDNFQSRLCVDVVCSKATWKILAGEGDDAILQMDISGVFLTSIDAGTDSLSQAETSGATTLHLTHAEKYEVGQKITVVLTAGGKSGATAGHEITAVDTSANTITIAASGLEGNCSKDAIVAPWVPSSTESGYTVHGRFGIVQETISGGSAANLLITEATIDLDNAFKVLNDEKTGTAFPNKISRGERAVDVSITGYTDEDGGRYRYQANNQVARIISIPASRGVLASSAGYRVAFSMPKVEFQSPETSGDEERTTARKGLAFATAALDDELTVTFY